jgi:hypothetical protein
MKRIPLLGAALVALALGLTSQAGDKSGWTNLLDKDFKKNCFTTGNWILGDDGIALVPRKGESGWTRYDMYLWAKRQYKDFECEFEYKVAKGGNSGFYFHVGDLKDPVKHGIEVQIYDSGDKKLGAKLTDHDSGGIIPGIPPTKNTAKKAGEWNKMRVTVKGNNVKVELNGDIVNDVPLDTKQLKGRPASGYIGWQDHGLPLWLRNIKVREL